jgi:hypothetical protein
MNDSKLIVVRKTLLYSPTRLTMIPIAEEIRIETNCVDAEKESVPNHQPLNLKS